MKLYNLKMKKNLLLPSITLKMFVI